MSSIDVNSVLSQIRAMSQQTAVKPAVAVPPLRGIDEAKAAQGGFGELVKQGIQGVNAAQGEAGALQQKFELGDPNTDLATVMVASAKAQVSFRAMVEVRNRVVNAYQEIMNMPL